MKKIPKSNSCVEAILACENDLSELESGVRATTNAIIKEFLKENGTPKKFGKNETPCYEFTVQEKISLAQRMSPHNYPTSVFLDDNGTPMISLEKPAYDNPDLWCQYVDYLPIWDMVYLALSLCEH